MGTLPSVIIAIDTETNARDVRCDPLFRVLGVSWATDEGECEYQHLPSGKDSEAHGLRTVVALQQVRSLLDRATTIVFHNAAYDLAALETLDICLWNKNWFDTLLMQHMIDENLPSKALDYLGKYYFNEGKEKDEEFKNFVKCFGWEFLPDWMLEPYAIQDAKLTLRLFQHLWPDFVRQGFHHE